MATQLSDTEYAVLGLLTFGERSGYELDKLARRSIGYFWQPAKSKIYAILPRLVERGLAVSSPVAQDGRPDKRLYRITASGEESLRTWLVSEEPVSRTTRDGLLVKLFFGGLGEVEGLRAQLLERKREAEQKLAELEEIDRHLDREEDFFPYLTLLHGLEVTRAMIRWVDAARRELDRHETRTRSRARG
ncbi:MAG TPA: helix-turn-helix transcriptional regulator [Gaiellaceae bacterium]|nr:helix-turn-helix transcriptional regulator [Gaiellaceae bacterium]